MPVEHRLSVRDGEHVREVMLVGTVTVGRSPTCEISSADPRLSRTHAAFDVVDGVVVVRDLGSRNGTTVNGTPITEHQLRAGEQVEVGPFIVELIAPAAAVVEPRRQVNSDDEATVMMPARAAAAMAAERSAADPASAAAPAGANDRHDSSSRTRLIPRAAITAEPPMATPVAPAAPDPERTQRGAPPAPAAALEPPLDKSPTPIAAAAAVPPPAAAAQRTPSTELKFAYALLLWIVPLALISFLAGLVPDFMQPDQRAPLLHAHYAALAAHGVDLIKTAREPAMPIDNVAAALRRQAGVTAARIIGADGRVLAPLDQAGTTVAPPSALTDTTPRIADAGGGLVEMQVPAQMADGRPALIALTIDPERIYPAPAGSPLATVLLLICLGAAWLVARRVTLMADSRLSRLGEEIELMTTRQISVGRDPFILSGARRILDAVTFALSNAGRAAGDTPRGLAHPDAAVTDVAPDATINADAAFRIVKVDQGCQDLLRIEPHTARGMHLIEALPDQAVAGEVMRLVTVATPAQMASGETVAANRGIRLRISVAKDAGGALSIHFKRL